MGSPAGFNDHPCTFFVSRDSSDKVGWYAKLLLVPTQGGKTESFWELRGVFNHWLWHKEWHISSWISSRQDTWKKWWSSVGVLPDSLRVSRRAADIQKLPEAAARHATAAVMTTKALLPVLAHIMDWRTSGSVGDLRPSQYVETLDMMPRQV